ncbi:DUF6600 domain-containing protein [Pedobacter arcticus]|uniref:DUF6600 domain-containing protein n=1 Tax=Pedobacter arcticus TaxID=752140 RepID=UPI00031E5DE8|nr:DUF6600 domain-containing protein [Pedobacter arcticus]
MRNSIKKIAWAFSVFFILISLGNNKAEASSRKDISLQVFYDELSYYGDWVNNPDYGYVWRPNVGSDFRPYYTNGHWVMTEYGNTWVSDYEWGWAPFHYGRWFYDKYDGWIWMPDTEWGPAWVTWRTGGGYYGWAPLAPRVSINIHVGRRYYVPDNYWVFIPQRCIYYPSYSRYWEPRRNVYIVNNTTIINNIYTNDRVRYYSGPGRDDVRRATRSDVPVYRVSDNSRPGSDRVSRGEVGIYRPNVDRSGNSAPRTTIASNTTRPSRGDTNIDRTLTNTDRSSSTNSTRPDRSGASSSDSRNTIGTSRSDVDRSSNSSRPERTESPRSTPSRTEGTRTEAPTTRSDVDRGSNSSRPERTETPRTNSPARTESTRSSTPSSSPQRSETQSSRPERMERSAPAPRTENSAPSRSAERSSAPSSSGSSSTSSSSRSGGSGRPSR